MKIIKRDGREVPYNYTIIKKAIEAANGEVAEEDQLTDTEVGFIVGRIEKHCADLGWSVGVEEIQDMVIDELEKSEHYRLALHYSEYRLRHELLRKKNSTDKKILSLLRHDNELAKQENANKDPIINSTMRDYLASEVSEDICRRYIFREDVIKSHDEGMIHIHDMGYVSGPISNCELVNLEDMLQNGTVITDTLIEKPHSFSTACNIATQIIAQVASNTYGGQTISLSHLAPFVDVSGRTATPTPAAQRASVPALPAEAHRAATKGPSGLFFGLNGAWTTKNSTILQKGRRIISKHVDKRL